MRDSISCVGQILSVTRTVADLERATAFYRAAMDFEPSGAPSSLTVDECDLLGVRAENAIRQEMVLGHQRLTLLAFSPSGAPYPDDSTSTDLWFQHCAVVVRDASGGCERVMAAGAQPISDGPQRLPPNTGGVTAFKFRDPFGQPFELLEFPPGVGDPVWRRAHAPLFLGIDHTAVAITDLAGCLAFYRDLLGLKVVDRTRNRGPAQDRLDAVPRDDVDVVALSPSTGTPHLELLAYRTGTRRRLPEPAAEDGAVTRTVAVGDTKRAAEQLTRARHPCRSGLWGSRPALTFSDPSGHTWVLTEG